MMTAVSRYIASTQRVKQQDQRSRALIETGRDELRDDLAAVLVELYVDYLTETPAPEGWALLKTIVKRMRVEGFTERVETELKARKNKATK